MRTSLLRVFALLMAGTLVVHELRYLLAFGEEAGETLERHGHGYLALVGPIVAAVMAAAAAQLLHRLAGGGRRRREGAVRLQRLWPVAFAAVLAMYAGQELLEGALSAGHPDGLAGVFGAGGWLAVPLSVVMGGVVALAVRVARAVERRAAAGIVIRPVLVVPASSLPANPPRRVIGALLAARLRGRAPPRVSVVR